ncbi:hypothetical protein AHAS_Ahas15G0205200 [Arachis hypogaea]
MLCKRNFFGGSSMSMNVMWFQVLMESTLHSKEMKLLACGPMIQVRHFGCTTLTSTSLELSQRKMG